MSQKAEPHRPIHVAHVLLAMDIGGMEKGVLTLLEDLDRSRFRQTLICLADIHPDLRPRVEASCADVHALEKAPFRRDEAVLWRLYRLLRRIRPDIVHSRNYPAIDTAWIAALAGVRVRLHGEHGRRLDQLAGLRIRERWRRRFAARFTHHFVALGEDLKAFLVHEIGADPRKVSVVYNGVDCLRFRPPRDAQERARARTALAAYAADPLATAICDPKHILIGSCGRLDPVKNYEALVAALGRLPAEWRARTVTVLIGAGAERLRLEALAAEAGLADRFLITGRASETAELLRALDVFVLPSRFEGLSNALLEAMATGLPIVATAVGGTPELVTAGVSAVLVPPDDEAALADALETLLSDPARREALGRHALERARGRFSKDAFLASYAALYERLAPTRGPRSRKG